MAGLVPATYVLVSETYPPKQKPRPLGRGL